MLGPPFDTLVTGKPWSGLMVVLEIVKLWPSPSFSGRGLFHYIADDDSEGHNGSYDDGVTRLCCNPGPPVSALTVERCTRARDR